MKKLITIVVISIILISCNNQVGFITIDTHDDINVATLQIH